MFSTSIYGLKGEMGESRAISKPVATSIVLILIALGGLGLSYWVPTLTKTTTLTTTTAVVSTSGTGSLYITSIAFSSGNVTVTVSNSGGGTPIVGYGNTGKLARWLGSIIIYNGQVYSRYAWPCPPTDSCAVAPGPWRYFAFEGNSASLNVQWNSGPGTYYAAPMTISGTMSVPLSYGWSPGASYTVYLQDWNSTIVYQQTVTAPS